jgi:hypothetical protein
MLALFRMLSRILNSMGIGNDPLISFLPERF